MFIEPNSHIKIYRGIESSGKKRPIFKTRANQTAYFNAHLAFDYTPTTHVKYTMNRVRVGLSVAQLLGCNYISFVNPSFGNKVYYANIIGDPVYINNEVTEISYAVDYAQTDMFEVEIESCYIDREQLSEEDYTKSVANPYDKTIQEFWTSEPLPVDKDLEDVVDVNRDSTYQFLACRKKWNGVTGYDKMMTVIAYGPITPPNAEDEQWYNRFLNAVMMGSQSEDYFGFVCNTTETGAGLREAGKFYGSPALYAAIGGTAGDPTVMELQTDFAHPYNIVATESDFLFTQEGGFLDQLTLWGAASSIICIHSLPAYMVFEMFKPLSEDHALVSMKAPTANINGVTPHNKKLFRFPFTYIRAISPNGDAKEFQFEKSTDVTDATPTVEDPLEMNFEVLTDYNGQPVVSLIPMNYKIKTPGGVSYSSAMKPNVYERLDFSAVPQVPYTTDAFLAGIAAANAEMLANRTLDYGYSYTHAMQQLEYDANDVLLGGYKHGMQTIKDIKDIGGDLIEGGMAAGTVAGIGVAIDKASDAGQRIVGAFERQNAIDRATDNFNYNRFKAEHQKMMVDDSASLSYASLESNSVYNNMRDTKPLYVSDKYVPAVGSGSYFYNDACVMDFILMVVRLRASIIEKYDQWFSNYGFSSGRYGVPHIMKYLQNAGTGKPHFAPSGGLNVTYIKTTDAAVKAPSKTSETFWEAMLDGGVQFIRGEDLIGD